MKQIFIFCISVFLLSGCAHQSKNAPVEQPTDPDEVISQAIADYLRGDKDAVRFSEAAQKDLFESSWPEVYCSVENLLDSPASFKDLVVRKVGEGQYRYECVCPDHGDRYVDPCIISASLGPDSVVVIEKVKFNE